MGGAWCKADRGQQCSYKVPFNSTLSRWTDNVRQAYRKPKAYHRPPPRPPQKPMRSSERLTISHPQLLMEQSTDGWRTATLKVPDPAPVPPPRKKRKRNQDLARGAFSMDDLDRSESLITSTISLPDKYPPQSGSNPTNSASTTLVVTPILESRLGHHTELKNDTQDENKENIKIEMDKKITEEEDEINDSDLGDEIIPIEKETLFSSRTILQSNLGYIDKLSAISEVSAESGFDDRTDPGKSSERSESVTSSESVPRDTGLNILAHIQNINTVSQFNEAGTDVREQTAISKKEWLQNILKDESEPYFISKDALKVTRRGSDSITVSEDAQEMSLQPKSLPTDHLHLMNRETETSAVDSCVNKTPPPSPTQKADPSAIHDTAESNHSVLLKLLQKNSFEENTSNPFVFKEESIFLTNTKTNIIYKSLSSDKLNDYDTNYSSSEETNSSQANTSCDKSKDVSKSTAPSERTCSLDSTNPFNESTSKPHLSDYSIQTPKLVESDPGLNSLLEEKKSNVVSSFDFKEIIKSQNYVTALKDLQLTGGKSLHDSQPNILVNGVDSVAHHKPTSETKHGTNDNIDEKDRQTKKDSKPSSRRSSITDSLHEFEMSIYDMLNESKKNRDSSDEEESLKMIKSESRK